MRASSFFVAPFSFDSREESKHEGEKRGERSEPKPISLPIFPRLLFALNESVGRHEGRSFLRIRTEEREKLFTTFDGREMKVILRIKNWRWFRYLLLLLLLLLYDGDVEDIDEFFEIEFLAGKFCFGKQSGERRGLARWREIFS